MLRSDEEKLSRKKTLKQFCTQILEQRIASTQLAMNRAQEAANEEEKSSAGDKYETSRAMNHLEKDMHARQLMDHLQALSALRDIPTDMLYDAVQPGAFIQCNTASFFIAAGLGKQSVETMPVIFLSPHSPLAKHMLNKRVGDEIHFADSPVIMEIY